MSDELPTNCKSCGAPVRWVTMASGKPMLVNVPGETRVVVVAGVGRMDRAYTSHFATCPNADDHRRRAGAA